MGGRTGERERAREEKDRVSEMEGGVGKEKVRMREGETETIN